MQLVVGGEKNCIVYSIVLHIDYLYYWYFLLSY